VTAGGSGSAAQGASPEPIIIDYPADGSVFPPEITPPTFLWHDPSPHASAWTITIQFKDDSPALRIPAAGEKMAIGEIDPRCVTPTNTPVLTAEQKETHTWKPDPQTWSLIKARSVKQPAAITISGYRSAADKASVSSGRVTVRTSKDPVGAPIFYRDVPLMPSEGEKGIIKPLPPAAIGYINWRLRDVGSGGSRTVLTGMPTCANCHSFSLDGKTMGIDVDGPQNDKGLYALVPIGKETVIRNEDIIQWSSFGARLGGKLRAAFSSQVSPDGRYVVNTIDDPESQSRGRSRDLTDKYYVSNFKDYRFLQVFFPTRGVLAWYSRETAQLQPLPGADDPRLVQTDGVWSPDGKYIVFARAEAKEPFPPGGKLAEFANDPNETQIKYDLYRIPFNGGKGGKPERIIGASANGMSNNFPKVSPDGKWIVFVRCRNGQLMRPDSQLYIVPSSGGKERRMKCNTPLMNSWHSFSPNGRWMVFSSKSRSPFTQMYLTHIDEEGNDTPPVLVENTAAANRAVNLPEFVNIPPDAMMKIDVPATEYFRVFDRAMEFSKKDEVDLSIAEWEKAAALNNGDARVYYNLGLALDKKGLRDKAAAQYENCLRLDPENGPAYSNLAVDLARSGKVDEAVEWLTKAVAAVPNDAKVHGNLGALLLQKGQIREAMAHCEKALEIDPQYADAHNSLAMILASAEKMEEAIAHLESAISANGKVFEYQFNLGRFLAAVSRFQDAAPHFEQAVALSGGREPMSLYMLSAMYGELEQFEPALRAAKRALAILQGSGNTDLINELTARVALYEARMPPVETPPTAPPPQ
jgi:tetratricopeptide (TPR) repeat protein